MPRPILNSTIGTSRLITGIDRIFMPEISEDELLIVRNNLIGKRVEAVLSNEEADEGLIIRFENSYELKIGFSSYEGGIEIRIPDATPNRP